MELRQLRYFVKVIEHGSFSQAAAALGVVIIEGYDGPQPA